MHFFPEQGRVDAASRKKGPELIMHLQLAHSPFLDVSEDVANAGMIELRCKLCKRLIVASREEFVFYVAVKAHRCDALDLARLRTHC